MTAAAPPVAARHEWVDAAKGIAIILVVLYHAILFSGEAGITSRWSTIASTLSTFRMPLFFFAAGLFAAKALGSSLGQLVRRRVVRLLWIYVLWSAIWLAVTAFAPTAGSGPSGVAGLLLLPVRPDANTWFVYALAVYFVLAWLLRRLPVWLQLAPAVALTVLLETNALRSGDVTLDKMGMYFTFFLLAVHSGRRVMALASRVRAWHAAAAALTYVGLTGAASVASLHYVPGVQLVLSAVAVITGVAVSVVLSRLRGARWLIALGSRTLPVYLLHFFPILLLTALLGPAAGSLAPVALLIPPALTVIGVVASLLVHRLTRRVPGLYALPAWLRRRTEDVRLPARPEPSRL
ncbi:acyltransferase family protein [Clavibacter capsici]|uniref:acyltransferase family protein n=1 Tax=Clavibacter capsici TaxID=1874630 RepID=UPI0014285DCB|nr:acyltransferase family protein [Clavibacter capsici]QIS41301.1 acyltransferase family protein [Clavibacter capsici]